MAPRRPPTCRRLLAATALTVTLIATAVSVASAVADHVGCYFDVALDTLYCPGHAGGDPANPGTGPGYYYTQWQFVGGCAGSPWIHFRRYKIYTDGVTPTERQDICVAPLDGTQAAWAVVAAAVAALTRPVFVANPDGDSIPGLTGLATWLWYPHPTQVGPIRVTWTDPGTGITSAVQGRGWVGTLTFNTVETRHTSVAASFKAGVSIGGTQSDPAATHSYHTTSVTAGYDGGYPVSVTLVWVGESRIRPPGAPWLAWTPIPNTLTQTATSSYLVAEVESQLTR